MVCNYLCIAEIRASDTNVFINSTRFLFVMLRMYWQFHDDVTKWKRFPCYWPFVMGINRSSDRWIPIKKFGNKGSFVWCYPKQTVDKTGELLVIWNAMTLMWCQCNAVNLCSWFASIWIFSLKKAKKKTIRNCVQNGGKFVPRQRMHATY